MRILDEYCRVTRVQGQGGHRRPEPKPVAGRPPEEPPPSEPSSCRSSSASGAASDRLGVKLLGPMVVRAARLTSVISRTPRLSASASSCALHALPVPLRELHGDKWQRSLSNNAEAWIEQRKWRDALVAQVPAFDPIALAGDIQRPSTRSGSRPRSPAVRTELFVGDRILSQYPRRSVTPTSERMTNRECAGQVHCPRNLAAQMRSDAASGSSFQARLAAKLKLGGGEKQWHLDCGVRPTCAAV